MTPELFMEWKKKKLAERDAGLAAQEAERAKNDRMRYILSLSHVPPLFRRIATAWKKCRCPVCLMLFSEHILLPPFQWP